MNKEQKNQFLTFDDCNTEKEKSKEQLIRNCLQSINFSNEFEFVVKVQKLEQRTIKSFSFNNSETLLFAGAFGEILIYSLFPNSGKLKLLFNLQVPCLNICRLILLKCSQVLLCLGEQAILLLKPNKNSVWQTFKRVFLQSNLDIINQIIVNSKENLIIGGTNKGQIIFWSQSMDWGCQQQIQIESKTVQGLDLNEEGQILIVLFRENLITIFELALNEKWIAIQNIDVNIGYRICFIGNNQFVYQGRGYLLQVYELDKEIKKFQYVSNHFVPEYYQCVNYFPQQFIKSRQILFSKLDRCICLFKKVDSKELEILQIIKFQTGDSGGRLSLEGNQLATWNRITGQLEIWKLRKLQ